MTQEARSTLRLERYLLWNYPSLAPLRDHDLAVCGHLEHERDSACDSCSFSHCSAAGIAGGVAGEFSCTSIMSHMMSHVSCQSKPVRLKTKTLIASGAVYRKRHACYLRDA